jgi:hypothetical protein
MGLSARQAFGSSTLGGNADRGHILIKYYYFLLNDFLFQPFTYNRLTSVSHEFPFFKKSFKTPFAVSCVWKQNYPNIVFQKQHPRTAPMTGASCVMINPLYAPNFSFAFAQTKWHNNTPYSRPYSKISLIRIPQRVSDDNTKTNITHCVRMCG